MNIIVLGPPGVGKGTQSAKIASYYGLNHVSTGELLRNEMRLETDIGIAISELMNSGKYVGDDIVRDLVLAQAQKSEGLVLDGFPRTVSQIALLEQIFTQTNRTLDYVINLKADDDVIINRILERSKFGGRSDDSLEIIKERLTLYYAETKVLIDHYQTITINSNDSSIDEVFEIIKQVLK